MPYRRTPRWVSVAGIVGVVALILAGGAVLVTLVVSSLSSPTTLPSASPSTGTCTGATWFDPTTASCVPKAVCRAAEVYDQKTNTCAIPGPQLDGVEPNAAHHAIHDLVHHGVAHAVVTQNVDGLHAAQKLRPAAAMDILAAIGKRLRQTSLLLRHSATRNANEVEVDNRSIVMKVADWISDFSGSLPFLFIHVGVFFVWIIMNIDATKGKLPGWGFDPNPFGLLTMSVSLEAIILSVFVLLSQNRQIERDRVRNEIEYEVNLKAELEIAHMHEKVDHMHAELMKRLERIERIERGK